MLQADSDDESDDYFDKAKGVAKKARVMSGSESIYENNSKHGLKRKFYSVGAKDVKNPKRSRRVKTAVTSKLSSHRPAPPRLFAGSRFGVRNTYYSDGRILASLSIHHVLMFFCFPFFRCYLLVLPGSCSCNGKDRTAIISLERFILYSQFCSMTFLTCVIRE